MTTLRFTVTDSDTAIALGSGDLPVLGTPRLVAWLEAATVAAAAERLDASSTSVGVAVDIRHKRPSVVGSVVEVEVTEVTEQDRGLAFAVLAREVATATGGEGPDGDDLDAGPAGPVLATGRIVRAVVDRAAFLARL